MPVVHLRRGLIVVLPVLLLLAPSVLAQSADGQVTVEGPASDAMIGRLQQWVRQDAMPTGQGVIQVVPENCMAMQAEACTYWTHAPQFAMYFPDLEYLWTEADHSEGERESTGLNFYHELGHVLDFGLHRHGYRLKWFEIMRYQAPESNRKARELAGTRNPSLWFSALDSEGEAVIPDEQFAQAYDYCAEGMGYQEMQATMRSTYWGFSYNPSARQYREACRLISSL